LDGGRSTSRTASGVIDTDRAAKPAAAPAAAAGTLSKAAQSLVDAGFLPEALAALENLGVKLTAKAAAKLKALGTVGRDFLNFFHRSKGFHFVVGDLLKGGNKEVGAKFVMRFVTQDAEILAKVKANPLNIAFEWGAGLKKGRAGFETSARFVDIVVRGDATLGEGDTIYNELKSWTQKTLDGAKNQKLPKQLVRDTAMLDPKNIRWVFDASKIKDPAKIIDTFITVIQKDAYLSKMWGTDREALKAMLQRVVKVI
jgi:hypothetical protein